MVAGVIGPMLVTGTMNLLPPHTFVITFIAQALVAAISAFILKGVIPAEPTVTAKSGGRSLKEIVRQPGFLKTVFSGAVAYMVMNFLMTAAPFQCICMESLNKPPIWGFNGTLLLCMVLDFLPAG